MSTLNDRHRLFLGYSGYRRSYSQCLPVQGTDDDWEVGGVNDPICPIELGFKGCKPGVPEDQILVPEACNQKSHSFLPFSRSYGEVDVLGQHPSLVVGAVDIPNFSGSFEVSGSKSQPRDESGVDEVVRGS